MSTRRTLRLLAIISGLACAPALKAQAVADLQCAFSLALKVTANTPPAGRYVSGGAYENSARFVTVSITQRDLLSSLIAQGKISAPLSGWSIVARVRSDEALGLAHELFAVKKDQPDFAMDDGEIDALAFESGFEVISFVERLNPGPFYTGGGTLRFNTRGTINTSVDTLYLSGNVTFPYTYKAATLNTAKVTIPVPGAVSFKLLGGAVLHEDFLGEFPVVIEGTMGLGVHKITAVRAAEPAP